eukprot:TRINITY_DN25910_c0_g1_i1.p1 TRINITY_DN25910_c0_g1~~TRINITY_DN25910_c0_g1_i1.p1  ORF type:complete len:219 (+),score=19.70 TRINITY_DN25910_c0_g1_i1:43-657(+)
MAIDGLSSPTLRPKEPLEILCPITHVMFRDPVMLPEAGRTYERSALERFWNLSGRRADPLSNALLERCDLFPNWDKRGEVQLFLDQNPDYVPEGWEDRAVPAVVKTSTLIEGTEEMRRIPASRGSGSGSNASTLGFQVSSPSGSVRSTDVFRLLRWLRSIVIGLVGTILLCQACLLLWAHRQLLASAMAADAEVAPAAIDRPRR